MINDAYDGLKPEELWNHFAELNAIPRPPGHEARAREYVLKIAANAGLTWQQDAFGNCVVRVPASPGVPDSVPTVVIQGHLDMVPAVAPGVQHDFNTDPIIPRRVGNLIKATGTTLGADNGTAVATALALITTPGLTHGPLELLFTVEEETGLVGASNLDPAIVSGRMMINLDSDSPIAFTVGCAGGATLRIQFPVDRDEATPGSIQREYCISGLLGGHSGAQIHEPRANAIKQMLALLQPMQKANTGFRLTAVSGGSAHNAIPRLAEATFEISDTKKTDVDDIRSIATAKIREAVGAHEPHMKVTESDPETLSLPIRAADQERLLKLLDDLPSGVISMSEEFSGKVQTSANLALVETTDDAVIVTISIRSFVEADIDSVRAQITAMAEAAGASVTLENRYPSWPPDTGSKLLEIAREVCQEVHGVKAEFDVVHAGLECGVIAAKCPGMEVISFGVTLHDAHSPDESVEIDTVEASWKTLVGILGRIAKG